MSWARGATSPSCSRTIARRCCRGGRPPATCRWRSKPQVCPKAERADRIANLLAPRRARPGRGGNIPSEMSGGMQQRLQIARCLAQNPKRAPHGRAVRRPRCHDASGACRTRCWPSWPIPGRQCSSSRMTLKRRSIWVTGWWACCRVLGASALVMHGSSCRDRGTSSEHPRGCPSLPTPAPRAVRLHPKSGTMIGPVERPALVPVALLLAAEVALRDLRVAGATPWRRQARSLAALFERARPTVRSLVATGSDSRSRP